MVVKFADRDIVQLLQELLAKGNQWTKEMEMRLTDTDVVLLDGETQVKIEIIRSFILLECVMTYVRAYCMTVYHVSNDSSYECLG